MTLPPWYSWFPIGERWCIPYEAPQGRRVNAIGAYFSHGPLRGRFVFQTWAALPKNKSQKQRKTPEEIAAAHGLGVAEVGAIDAPRLRAFLWDTAGRPAASAEGWQRDRPLVIVLDNYSVHKSQIIQDALPALEAADVFLLYLPSYCPQLSRIEPVWNDVKHNQMQTRSCAQVKALKEAVEKALKEAVEKALKEAVEKALAQKAEQLWQDRPKTTTLEQRAA